MIPPDTNRGPTVAGGWVMLGGRMPAQVSCRDEVATALATLGERTGQLVFRRLEHLYPPVEVAADERSVSHRVPSWQRRGTSELHRRLPGVEAVYLPSECKNAAK